MFKQLNSFKSILDGLNEWNFLNGLNIEIVKRFIQQ